MGQIASSTTGMPLARILSAGRERGLIMTMLTAAIPVSMTGAVPTPQRLNDLLGMELAAHACYSLTADVFRDSGRGMWVGLLRQLAEEHELAADSIRQQINDLGSDPADESGSLGLWASVARSMRADELSLLEEARRAEG